MPKMLLEHEKTYPVSGYASTGGSVSEHVTCGSRFIVSKESQGVRKR